MSYNWYHNFAQLARDSGFCLRDSESDSYIDWRFIASIDTNRIVKDNDFEKLDECLPHILSSGIGSMLNIRILDPAIGKYFVISQLVVQFLLFCKQFLDKTVTELRETIFQGQRDALRMEKLLQKRDDEIHNLQRKLNKFELMQHVFPCKSCTKNFISEDLLNVHISRKHAEKENAAKAVDMDSTLINTIKLELEIKQLKERLNGAEKQITDQKNSCEKCNKNSQEVGKSNICIQTNFDEVKEKDELESGPRSDDFIEKTELQGILNAQLEQFENWKQKDEEKYHKEIQELKKRLDDTIDLLKKSEPTQSVEPVIRSRIPIVTRVQESPAVDKIDKMENEKWKLRYNQLEEKYLDGQKLVNSTIENMEKAYNAKLKTIENSVNMIKSHKVNKPPEPTFKPVSRLNPPPLAGITLRNPVRSQSAHSVSSEMIDPPRVAKRNLLNQTRPALNNSSSSETSSESESEGKSGDDSKSLIKQIEVYRTDLIQKASVNSFKKNKSIKLDESLQKLENISPPAEPIPPQAAPREVFSAQKVNIKEKPKKRTKTLPIEDVDYKDAALTAFEERIKAMGLDERHKVKQKDFAAINEEIVKNREGIKKKFKSFFITRKKLSTEVDKIAQEKFKIPALDPSLYLVEEDQHKKFKSHLRKSRNTEKLKGQKYMTHQIEEISAEEPKKTSKNLSKSVKNLSISDLSEPSMEQPEVESPKIFFEELQRSIAFSRNVTSKAESPKVLEVPPKNIEEPQERSNLHNLYRITPNKKKVGFNLDTIPDEEEGKSSPAPNILPAVKDYKELRKELSDSDWNISSFEDEEVVDGKFVKH